MAATGKFFYKSSGWTILPVARSSGYSVVATTHKISEFYQDPLAKCLRKYTACCLSCRPMHSILNISVFSRKSPNSLCLKYIFSKAQVTKRHESPSKETSCDRAPQIIAIETLFLMVFQRRTTAR